MHGFLGKVNNVFKASAQPEPSVVATAPAPIPEALKRRITKKQNQQTPRDSKLQQSSHGQSQSSDRKVITSIRSDPYPSSPPTSHHASQFRVQPDMIRQLRKEIQARYALDVQIWSKGRNAKTFQRGPVEAKMRKSDAILRDIRSTLQDWDNRNFFEKQATYETFRDIKWRMDATGKREWEKHPPWGGQGEGRGNVGSGTYGGWQNNRYG